MSKKGEERDNSPSKHTCRCPLMLARLQWEWVAKLSLWAEFSPFPSWHRKFMIEKNIRCSNETWAKMVKELNLTFKINMSLPIDVGKVVVRDRKQSAVFWGEFSPFPSQPRKYAIEKL